MGMTSSRTHRAADVGLGFALGSMLLTAAALYLGATFTFMIDTSAAQLREAAIGLGGLLVVSLVLTALILRVRRPPTWVWWTAGAVHLAIGALAVHATTSASTARIDHVHQDPGAYNVGVCLIAIVVLPTSWPLLGYAVAALRQLRGRSSRAPR